MHIKVNLKKHRFSPFLSWTWLLAGAMVFMCIHRGYFAPIFAERFQNDFLPVRPLYWGAIICYLAVGWSLFSGRKLPYSNTLEVLSLTALLATCTLLLVLAATREFYSGTYLLFLFCFQLLWLGLEVCFRNRFVIYRFAIFPSSIPLTADDFLEYSVVFPEKENSFTWMDGIDAVVVDFATSLEPKMQKLLLQCQQKGISIISLNTFLENVWGRIPVELLGGAIGTGNISFRPYLIIKPILERSLALLGLIVSSPIIIVAAIAVKMTSEGSVLFRQQRVGLKGIPFTIYKLRTMQSRPDDQDGSNDGSKITAIGSLLRRYHIDELPQLINVLKGDMALVGPRPETVELTEVYQNEIPGYILRNQLLPGVISWALIHQGHVHGVKDTAVKLSYDLFYLKHISLFLDFYIILKTVWIIVSGTEKLSSPGGVRMFTKK